MQPSPPADPERRGEPDKDRKINNRRELIRYAGLSSEVLASVGIAVFLGIKADKWLKVSFPIFSMSLPLLVIIALIVRLVKESSRKK
ncbi:MAG TPA: AtpZ/AtpI family protein [Puia sp.]